MFAIYFAKDLQVGLLSMKSEMQIYLILFFMDKK